MAGTKTTYIDPNGVTRTGYIINDRTYEDENGTRAVGVGSIVKTDSGNYIKTADGSMLYSDYLKQGGGSGGAVGGTTANASYIDSDGQKQPGYTGGVDFDSLMEDAKAARDAAVASSDAEYNAQLRKTQSDVEGQIQRLNTDFDNSGRQLYRDFMQQKKNLPQILSAQGVNGGLAESSLIRLANNYEGGLNENERERAMSVANLRRGVSDAEVQLAIQRAQQQAAAEDNLYTRINAILMQAQQQQERDLDRQREDENLAYTRALQEAQIAQKLGDSTKINELLGITTPTPSYSPQPKKLTEDDFFNMLNQMVADDIIDPEAAIAAGNAIKGYTPATTPTTPTVAKPSGSSGYNQYLIQQALR